MFLIKILFLFNFYFKFIQFIEFNHKLKKFYHIYILKLLKIAPERNDYHFKIYHL